MEAHYLTAGEFAKLCNVDKKTLYYYEEIGLLLPEKRDEKGYRYYLGSQFDKMNAIKSLQNIGMSLKEIHFLIHEANALERIDIISKQVEMLDKLLQNIQVAKKFLNLALSNYQSYVSNGIDNIFFEDVLDKNYQLFEVKKTSLNFFTEFSDFGAMFVTDENGTVTKIPPYYYQETNEPNFTKKGGKYVSIYQKIHSHESNHHVYIQNFCDKLKKDNIEIENTIYYDGTLRELFFSDHQMIVKISAKIKEV